MQYKSIREKNVISYDIILYKWGRYDYYRQVYDTMILLLFYFRLYTLHLLYMIIKQDFQFNLIVRGIQAENYEDKEVIHDFKFHQEANYDHIKDKVIDIPSTKTFTIYCI